MLTELDRLVQLLESPIFTPLRMEVYSICISFYLHLFVFVFVGQCSVQFFSTEIYGDQFLFVVKIAFSSHL